MANFFSKWTNTLGSSWNWNINNLASGLNVSKFTAVFRFPSPVYVYPAEIELWIAFSALFWLDCCWIKRLRVKMIIFGHISCKFFYSFLHLIFIFWKLFSRKWPIQFNPRKPCGDRECWKRFFRNTLSPPCDHFVNWISQIMRILAIFTTVAVSKEIRFIFYVWVTSFEVTG